MTIINKFIQLNQQIAQLAPLWTQGAGSNLSIKLNEQFLVIKASGYRLDGVTPDDGHVQLDYSVLSKHLQPILTTSDPENETKYSQFLISAKAKDNTQLRPSMEGGFHAVSKFKYVLHFHSLPSILMSTLDLSQNLEFQNWKNNLKKSFALNFIPSVKPGLELTKYFINNDHQFNIIVNHGVVLQSNKDDVLSSWNELENSFLKTFKFDLIENLKSQIQEKKTITNLERFLKGPLRFYFPDMAIYYSKLKPFLISIGNNEFKLADEASLDLKEIWAATQILFQSLSTIPELDEKMIQDITQLPTEKLRQQFIKDDL